MLLLKNRKWVIFIFFWRKIKGGKIRIYINDFITFWKEGRFWFNWVCGALQNSILIQIVPSLSMVYDGVSDSCRWTFCRRQRMAQNLNGSMSIILYIMLYRNVIGITTFIRNIPLNVSVSLDFQVRNWIKEQYGLWISYPGS